MSDTQVTDILEEVRSELRAVRTRAAARLMTVEAAADYLGCTPRALRARMDRRQVPYVQPNGDGGKRYLDRRDLDALIERKWR